MLQDDMIARYYGAKPGDIFMIERASEISGFSISFRLIV
jgi:DNA-directed RNA polymerase subunit H (RpoH/RPB5)